MDIGRVLANRAFITPNRPALIFEDKVISFLELNARTNRVARALLALGVKPGDRVGLLMNNCPQYVEVFFASARIGAVLVPLNVRLAPAELDYILEDCGVCGLIYGAEFQRVVDALTALPRFSFRVAAGGSPAEGALSYEAMVSENGPQAPGTSVKESDLLAIMYTSGTTGNPKGVMLTHYAVYHGALNLLIGLDYQYPDKCLMLAPLFHTGASTPIVGHFIKGICTVLMEKFDPAAALKLIEKHKINSLQGVTAMMRMILDLPNLEAYDLGSWRLAILPGSPLPYSLIKSVHDRFGVLCQNLWGMTEITGPGALMNIEDILDKPESAGKPYFEVELRIADAAGNLLPDGETGELLVRCPHMMLGYWNLPQATRDTIVDGWIRTGDMAHFDRDDYLYIVDRIKDMIVSGGENVYPAEVEKVLLEMPGIAEASVVGIPDEKWGEAPKAFLVTTGADAPSDQDIIQFCRTRLAGYKIPRRFERVEYLPKTPSGKVLKRKLREASGIKSVFSNSI